MLYGLGAVVFEVFEPTSSGFLKLGAYSWWFLVTVTTVGYGDISPTSGPARFAAGAIMLIGIGTIGVVLGKMGGAIFEIGRKRMRGLAQLRESDHIAIFGYNQGETEHMIREIIADSYWADRSIVLCSALQEENPIPDRVKFVHGPLSSDDVMQRACIADASVIITQCHDDRTTIVTAIAANAVNPNAHIVVNLDDAESQNHILRINPNIECVIPLRIPMTVQAIQDPGITRVMHTLLSNVDDDVLFRLQIPEAGQESSQWRFGTLLEEFKRGHNAILIGVSAGSDPGAQIDINPPSDQIVRNGMMLYYIAAERLLDLNWSEITVC